MTTISALYEKFRRFASQGKALILQRVYPVLTRNAFSRVASIACLLIFLYWGVLASDRYVSEAHVVLKRVDMSGLQSQVVDLGTVLTGGGNSGSRGEQLLLRDYLLSVDMLKKLDATLDLKSHYTSWWRDPFSRMWLTSQEWFHRYYLNRVSAEIDDYSGVLVITVQAYTPEMAQAIGRLLVDEGERHMNEMSHRIAREQVAFLQREVEQVGERAARAREEVLAFQNKKGLISPQNTAETLAGIINGLEAKLTELKTRRSAMIGYMSPSAPGVVDLNLQIGAVERQIESERARLVSTGNKTLNRTVEEYQRLQMTAELSQDMYKTALIALEKGRIEAMRAVNKVAVLQMPTLPEYPNEPRRIYNSFMFIVSALLIAGIVHLLRAIIREHKD